MVPIGSSVQFFVFLSFIGAALSQISCGVKGPPLPPLATLPQKTEPRALPSPNPSQSASPSPTESTR